MTIRASSSASRLGAAGIGDRPGLFRATPAERVLRLCRGFMAGPSIFRYRRTGFVAIVLLLAATQGAGRDDLYSTGFTHTWAVFPLAIAAMALAYRDRYAMAFLLAE